MGYLDPVYVGKDHLYLEHPDYAGPIDHGELIGWACREFPDGWALSCSAESLPSLLRLPTCPVDVRVAAWFRGERPTKSYWPLNAWEPVIVHGGRPLLHSASERRVDALVYVSRPRLTDPRRVIGMKPAEFIWWMFEQLGVLPGDELVDVFPGSGGVGRAWSYVSSVGA